MRTVTFHKGNRSDDLLHIETDGCIVNIRVGLTDNEGRKVTSIEILKDNYAGESVYALDGHVNTRVLKLGRVMEVSPKEDLGKARYGWCVIKNSAGRLVYVYDFFRDKPVPINEAEFHKPFEISSDTEAIYVWLDYINREWRESSEYNEILSRR